MSTASPYVYDEKRFPVAWATKEAENEYWSIPEGKIWQDHIRYTVEGANVFETIKQRVGIIHMAEKYGVQIQHKGRYVMITCPDPEHEDNNPSCAVWTDSNFFKCFACGRKGDVIEYTKLMELSKQ